MWRLHTNRSDDFGTKTAQHRRLKEMAKIAEFPRGKSGSVVNYSLIPGWWKESEQLKDETGMQVKMEILELT